MKKITLSLLCFFAVYLVNAQQRAVTEMGDPVILYDDGTWEYQNEPEDIIKTDIPTNPKPFEKDNASNFLLKSKKLDVGFWLDAKEWSFEKAASNPEAEYELQLKGGDLYGMIITEKIEIPLEMLKSIAIENARLAAPDSKIVEEEYRMVNGLKVLMLRIDGSMQGIKFSYFGYYFSNENGTVQFITYTAQNLIEDYYSDCEKLLNGLVELN